MPRVQELFHWWNAIYAAPLLFALIYLALANLLGMFAAGGEGAADANVDVDAGAHASVEPDIDVDIDASAEADAHAGHAHNGHGFGGFSAGLHHLLGLFGVGRAPLALVVEVWVLFWGVIGLGINSMLARSLDPSAMVAVSMPSTFFTATLLTRGLASLIGKYLPPVQTFVWSRQQFVGKMGEVVYPVTGDAGTIHLRDGSGTIHRVRARSTHERLEPGQRIIVLGYDAEKDLYTVDDAVRFTERRD